MPEHECTSGMGIICISVLIPLPSEENGNGYQSWDAAGLTGALGRGGTTEEITYPLLPSAPTKPEPPQTNPHTCPSLLALRGSHLCSWFKDVLLGTSLVVQWLRLHTSNAGAQVWSLVQEVRSHRLHYTAKKKKKIPLDIISIYGNRLWRKESFKGTCVQ